MNTRKCDKHLLNFLNVRRLVEIPKCNRHLLKLLKCVKNLLKLLKCNRNLLQIY